MIKQKYIGIENELKSFNDHNNTVDFTYYFNLMKSGEYYNGNGVFKADSGNNYYVDCDEIEIVTPPIAINEGFASRLTDMLVLGRNDVINSTPNLQHTGYSMHWNVSTECDHKSFYYDIAIPFQLFGLTPLSCGFAIRNRNSDNKRRFEILGDSLVNVDQIQATALLLGAYTLAKSKHDFPILVDQVVSEVSNLGSKDTSNQIDHMLKDGRYTLLNIRHRNNLPMRYSETQAQNVLELFYDWLSPFVYQVGERDEIRNLESFITGEKKLEIDDQKYFYMLEQYNGYFYGTYLLDNILISDNNIRNQILTVIDVPKVPREGALFGKIIAEKLAELEYMYWNKIRLRDDDGSTKKILGLNNIYRFAEKLSDIKYFGTKDTSDIKPNKIFNASLQSRLDSRIYYNPKKDNSAIISNKELINKFKKRTQNIVKQK